MVIRRIGVLSLAKLTAVLYGGIGLLYGILILLFLMVGGGALLAAGGGEEAATAMGMGMGLGIFVAIGFPFFCAIAGFIGGLIIGWLYNLAAGFVGGLEIETQ